MKRLKFILICILTLLVVTLFQIPDPSPGDPVLNYQNLPDADLRALAEDEWAANRLFQTGSGKEQTLPKGLLRSVAGTRFAAMTAMGLVFFFILLIMGSHVVQEEGSMLGNSSPVKLNSEEIAKLEKDLDLVNGQIKEARKYQQAAVESDTKLKQVTNELENLNRSKSAVEKELTVAKESKSALIAQATMLNRDKENLQEHAKSLAGTIENQRKILNKLEKEVKENRGGNGGFEPILGARLETKV